MKRKKQFSGDMLLAANPLEDWNKVRAMKIMSSIIRYYDQKESFLGAFVSCRMLEISIKYGHCEDSVYGAAAFASALINCLGDIDDGSAWGRSALSLMKKHGQQMPGPSIYATLFGTVFVWKGEPASPIFIFHVWGFDFLLCSLVCTLLLQRADPINSRVLGPRNTRVIFGMQR
jgi:ATP-dependent RNA helicase DDX31/DBP7